MIAVVQRVTRARVTVGGEVVGEIGRGLCVLVPVVRGDGDADVKKMAQKLVALRVFPSAAGAYDLDVRQVGGGILLVSNFTVAADVTGGRRPSFTQAMPPGEARPVFEALELALRTTRVPLATGTFGAEMSVEIANDGPLTLIVDTRG